MKTVCIFGIYDFSYNRTQLFIQGFRANGWQVVECHVNPRQFPGIRKYLELYRLYRSIQHHTFDVVLVAFPGHTVVWFARLLFGKGIIFDAFVSLYDSYIHDRKIRSRYGLYALLYWLLDWIGCSIAQQVLLDTNAHITYFVHTFHIPQSKFIRVLAVPNEAIFTPRKEPYQSVFTVHFHGTFIPLQGISYIIEAAYLLKDKPIQFRIVGGGQEFSHIQKRTKELQLQNVEFIPYVPLEQLPTYIASAHMCLGIFGDTEKTQRVIPNKVFECMAMGKGVITGDTPAIHELEIFGHPPLHLVETANAPALAESITMFYMNERYRNELGEKAHAFFIDHLRARDTVKALIEDLELQ